MKKLVRIFSLMLAFSLVFSLFACGKQEPEAEETEPTFDWTIDLGEQDPDAPKKVILILVDGMRPEALEQIPQAQVMMQHAYYTLSAKTVVPPITLPVHVSIFHSLEPSVHGVEDNSVITYQGVSIYDVLTANGKKSAMIYSWEPLRDLMKPGNKVYSYRKTSGVYIGEAVNEELTVAAIEYIATSDPDFTFLYLGHPDSMGHTYEWMSEEYLTAIQSSWNRIQRVVDAYSKTHTIIIASDHGGHEKSHGKDIPDDMTVPLFILSKDAPAGQISGDASILDIAPTIVDLFGVESDPAWQGKSLLP